MNLGLNNKRALVTASTVRLSSSMQSARLPRDWRTLFTSCYEYCYCRIRKGLQKPLPPRRLRVRVVFADRSVSTGLKICVQGCTRFYRNTTD
jgi:hypothetical protein